MATERRKVKVQIYGAQAKKTAMLEAGATLGATIGTDLRLPDGSVPSLDRLKQIFAASSTAAPVLGVTLWGLIREIPQNIVDLAALAGDGIVYRAPGGGFTADGALFDLSDVLIVAPIAGDVLTFNGLLWEAAAPTGGAGGGYPPQLGYARV